MTRPRLRHAAIGLLSLLAACQSAGHAQPHPSAKATPSSAPAVASQVKYDPLPPAPQLTTTLTGEDAAVYQRAVTAAESAHRGRWTVALTGKDGQPLKSEAVTFKLLHQDFLFGTDLANNDKQYRLFQQAGLNLADVPTSFTWAATEPSPGAFRPIPGNIQAEMDRYVGDGISVMAHNMLWLPPPGYDYVPAVYQNMPFDRFVQAYHDHVLHLAQSEKGKVAIWDIVNEPMTNWANAMNLDESQWQRLVKAGTDAVHEGAPGSLALVNSYGVKYDGIQHHPTKFMEPLAFFTDLVQKSVPYDITGLELYYNSTWGSTAQPGRYSFENGQMSMAELNGWLDKYGALKKPILVTEFEANAAPYPDGGRHNTMWGQPWSPKLQADYVQAEYTLFFSRPDVIGTQYWDHNDGPPVYQGGIVDAGDNPREALTRMAALIHHWSTRGSGKTSSSGTLDLDGFAGVYEIDTPGPDGKPTAAGYIDLREGEAHNFTLQLKG
jgi:GH35 family endo-1,4-beta-xylanase